ncbi:MAG: ABC transporter permease [Anaerolineae bacterium]|jgi:ABC-2 type transport system permease protein
MWLRIGTLVRKELIQLSRDWVMTAFILTLPVLQLVLLARSTSSSIADLSVAVLDRDRSSASRRLVRALDNTEALEVDHYLSTLGQTQRLLDGGEAVLVVVVLEGFSSGVQRASQTSSIQLIADASNDLVAGIALEGARAAIAEFAEAETSVRTPTRLSVVDLRTTVRYNPTFDVKQFAVPAQVGFIVYQVTLAVASIGLARERELGTLEQLMVVPLGRVELVIGKAIPALVVGMLNFLLMMGAAVLGFGIPMRGSIWLLAGLSLLFVAAQIGYGIFISGIARTQQQAILLVFVLAMVDMAFSGYLVPIKNLPAALQVIARVVPLRHYLTIVRGVMLKSAGLDALWTHAAAIGMTGLLVSAFAVRNLNRRLD